MEVGVTNLVQSFKSLILVPLCPVLWDTWKEDLGFEMTWKAQLFLL